MKKLIVTGLIVVACVWAVKKTQAISYARVFWSQAQKEVKDAVPTRFEIERARQEIAHLDGDINGMIRPIAEYMAAITRVKKDIRGRELELDTLKADLLTMTRDLEKEPSVLVYDGREYSADRVRAKLEKDFESYKRLEGNLQSQRKLLEAKETSLKATQDQLAKVVSKKREYEVRLAQLEADEETLQIAKLGTKLHIDDSRATQIEAALAEIEHRQNVQRAEVELVTGGVAGDSIAVSRRNQTKLDLGAIRDHLEGKATTAQK